MGKAKAPKQPAGAGKQPGIAKQQSLKNKAGPRDAVAAAPGSPADTTALQDAAQRSINDSAGLPGQRLSPAQSTVTAAHPSGCDASTTSDTAVKASAAAVLAEGQEQQVTDPSTSGPACTVGVQAAQTELQQLDQPAPQSSDIGPELPLAGPTAPAADTPMLTGGADAKLLRASDIQQGGLSASVTQPVGGLANSAITPHAIDATVTATAGAPVPAAEVEPDRSDANTVTQPAGIEADSAPIDDGTPSEGPRAAVTTQHPHTQVMDDTAPTSTRPGLLSLASYSSEPVPTGLADPRRPPGFDTLVGQVSRQPSLTAFGELIPHMIPPTEPIISTQVHTVQTPCKQQGPFADLAHSAPETPADTCTDTSAPTVPEHESANAEVSPASGKGAAGRASSRNKKPQQSGPLPGNSPVLSRQLSKRGSKVVEAATSDGSSPAAATASSQVSTGLAETIAVIHTATNTSHSHPADPPSAATLAVDDSVDVRAAAVGATAASVDAVGAGASSPETLLTPSATDPSVVLPAGNDAISQADVTASLSPAADGATPQVDITAAGVLSGSAGTPPPSVSPTSPVNLQTVDSNPPAPAEALVVEAAGTTTTATAAASLPPSASTPASHVAPVPLQTADPTQSTSGQPVGLTTAAMKAVAHPPPASASLSERVTTAVADLSPSVQGQAADITTAAAAVAAKPVTALPNGGAAAPTRAGPPPRLSSMKRKPVVEESEDEKEDDQQDSMAVGTQEPGEGEVVATDPAETSVDAQASKKRKTPAKASTGRGISKAAAKKKQGSTKSTEDDPPATPLPAPTAAAPSTSPTRAAPTTGAPTAAPLTEHTAAAPSTAATPAAAADTAPDHTAAGPFTVVDAAPDGSAVSAAVTASTPETTSAAVAEPPLTKAQRAAAAKKEKEMSKKATTGPVNSAGRNGNTPPPPAAVAATGNKRSRSLSSKAQEALDAAVTQRGSAEPTQAAPLAPSPPNQPTIDSHAVTVNTTNATAATVPPVQPSSAAAAAKPQPTQPTANASPAIATAPAAQPPAGHNQSASPPGGNASLPLPPLVAVNDEDPMPEVLACLATFENAARAMSSSFQRLLESDLPASVKQEFAKNSKDVKASLYSLAYDADSPYNMYVALCNAWKRRAVGSTAEQGTKNPAADPAEGQQPQKKAKLDETNIVGAATPAQNATPTNAPNLPSLQQANNGGPNSNTTSNGDTKQPAGPSSAAAAAAATAHTLTNPLSPRNAAGTIPPVATHNAASSKALPATAAGMEPPPARAPKGLANGTPAKSSAAPLPQHTTPPTLHTAPPATSPRPTLLSSPAADKSHLQPQQPNGAATPSMAVHCNTTSAGLLPRVTLVSCDSTGDDERDDAIVALHKALIKPFSEGSLHAAVHLEKELFSRFLESSASHQGHATTCSFVTLQTSTAEAAGAGGAAGSAAAAAAAAAGTARGQDQEGSAEPMEAEGPGVGPDAYNCGLYRVCLMLTPGGELHFPNLAEFLRDGIIPPASLIEAL